MKFSLLTLIIIIFNTVYACYDLPIKLKISSNLEIPRNDLCDLQKSIQEVLITHPVYELLIKKNASIKLIELKSKKDFFHSRFKFIKRALGKHEYIIKVNPLLFKNNKIPLNALKAILAHEFFHTYTYISMRPFFTKIIQFGLKYLKKKHRIRIERQTDLETIHIGHAQGLKVFRLWLYSRLSKNQIKKKKKTYFTPKEIDLIEATILARPHFYQYWKKNIPLNIHEVRLDTQEVNSF